MVDLEELEMADLGETDMFDFESTDFEGGLYEGGLYEGGFDGESDYEGLDPEGYLYEGLDPEGTDLEWGAYETSDLEADPFLGPLISKATRNISRAFPGSISPGFLKQLAQQAAKVAGGAIGGPAGASIAAQIAGNVLREGDLYYESSWESSWYETDAAMEGDPLMEAMSYNAAMAAEAASDQEAAPFIDAIAELAGPVLSSLLGETADPLYEDGFDGETDTLGERDEFLPALIPFAAPLIGRGIKALGSLLSRNPRTRSLWARCRRWLPKPPTTCVASGGSPPHATWRRRWPGARPASSAIRPRCRRRCGRTGSSPRAPRRDRPCPWERADHGTMGTAGAALGNRGGMRRYGIFYGPPARDSRTGRPVVGYELTPIYSSSRGRS